tara:strand:- start:1048 stop:3690 length:2643 start_codon:yes stop_codon:yes gene_type:complete
MSSTSLQEKQQKEKEKRVQDLLKSYYHNQQQQEESNESDAASNRGGSTEVSTTKSTTFTTNVNKNETHGIGPTKKEENRTAASASTSQQQQQSDNSKITTNKNTIEMLKTKTIGELQNEYVNVSREIKRLESHGTHSVYENYSKFINAADFIENARPEIEQLTKKESEKVEKATKEVAEAARKLNETLDAKRFESERAREVQNVLFNLQEALKAPETIRNVLFGVASSANSSESVRVEKAVRIIAKTKPMLEKFSSPLDGGESQEQHKSGRLFSEAKIETVKISDAIATLLKKRVRSSYHGAGSSQTIGGEGGSKDDANSLENLVNKLSSQSCAECLKFLGVPRDEVHEEFLYAEKDKLEKVLTDLESNITKSSSRSDLGGAESSTTVDSLFKPKLGKVNELFLNEFQKFAASYLEVFPQDGRHPLIDFAKVVFRRYFELLKLIFINADAPHEEGTTTKNLSSVRHLCAALGNMAADLASAHKLLPECALGDRVTEIVERTIRKRIEDAHLRRESILSEKISQIEHLLSLENNTSVAAASPTIVADAVEDFLNTHESTANDIITDIKSFSEERPLLLQSWRDEFGRFSRALFATSHHALCARLVGLGSCRADSSCIPYLSPSQGLPNSPYLLHKESNKTGGSSTASSLIASVLLFKIANESYTLENGIAKIFPSHVASEKGKRSAAYDERLLRAMAMSCFRECFREFLLLSTSKLDALLIQYENTSITELFVDALEKIKQDVKNIEASTTLVQMLNSSTSEPSIDDAGVVLNENAFDIFECKNKFSTARIVRSCIESSLSNFQEYIFANVPTFTKETLKHFEEQCDAIKQELNREFHENTETHETCFSSLKTLARKRDIDGATYASSPEASKLLKDIQQI